MAGLRLAGKLLQAVPNLFKGASKADLAMRFGPDLAYSAMAGTIFAPDNATLGERGLLAGEDLLYGVGSSIAGQLAGRRLGRSRGLAQYKADKAKGFASKEDHLKSLQQAHNTVNAYQTGGDVLGQMGMVMLPRTMSAGVYEAAGERANQSQEQITAAQQELFNQEMLAAAALSAGIPAAIAGGQRAVNTVRPSIEQMILTG